MSLKQGWESSLKKTRGFEGRLAERRLSEGGWDLEREFGSEIFSFFVSTSGDGKK